MSGEGCSKIAVNLLIVVFVLAAIGIFVYFFVLEGSLGSSDTTENNPATAPVIAPNANVGSGQFELPRLNDDQLEALINHPEDLPDPYRDQVQTETYVADINISTADLQEVWDQAGDRLALISQTYNWKQGIAAEFNTCRQDRPVSLVVVEVYQLASAATARAFIDDPALRGLFTGLQMNPVALPSMHGWAMETNAPIEGECFAQENRLMMLFEHWGLLFYITLNVDANADVDQAGTVVSALVMPLIGRVDALGSAPPPPTPILTPAADSLMPWAEIADLPSFLPTLGEIGIPSSSYVLNYDVSHTYTLEQLVQAYTDLGYTGLADAIARAGSHYGMIGQETRFWDGSTNCPNIVGLSIQMDIALFQTPAGARDYMNDAALQEAWRTSGLLSSFSPDGGEVILQGSRPGHACGPLVIWGKMVPTDRVLTTVAIYAYAEVNSADVLDIADALAQYVTAKALLSNP